MKSAGELETRKQIEEFARREGCNPRTIRKDLQALAKEAAAKP